jgi:hypothetical protein
MTVAVTTYVFGTGTERKSEPVCIPLAEWETTARELIAEHVRAEVGRAQEARAASLALHYLLADDPRLAPAAALDVAAETARAHQGLRERRYVLVVDGAGVAELDRPLTLHERSVVYFMRLLPLIGG